MSTTVQLPPGCYGLDVRGAPRGKYTARDADGKVKPGGTVVVEDHHAAKIKRSQNGQLGLISGQQALSLGTKGGRRCTQCRFLGQVWAEDCPRCGAATVSEQQKKA